MTANERRKAKSLKDRADYDQRKRERAYRVAQERRAEQERQMLVEERSRLRAEERRIREEEFVARTKQIAEEMRTRVVATPAPEATPPRRVRGGGGLMLALLDGAGVRLPEGAR